MFVPGLLGIRKSECTQQLPLIRIKKSIPFSCPLSAGEITNMNAVVTGEESLYKITLCLLRGW